MHKSSLQLRNRVTDAHSTPKPFLRPTATALAVAACFSCSLALANPTAPTVVNGIAGFAQAGNILNITNSPNAIINWGSFSIGVNELTRFLQQSASSAVLNRVIGQDPSAILGALQSNGRVFLLNPNGIVFGAGSQVDVAGLVASTLNLSNQDFLNNRLNFTDGAGAGSVVNQGSITGGSVYLVGNAVTNDGLITSPQGEVILAAGNSVELVSPGTPNLRVEIVAPDNEARNLGTITAEAGRIGIYAGLINNSGTLNASSAVVEGGRIVLKATQNTTLEAGSLTTANGNSGGSVEIQSGDTTLIAGTVSATGAAGDGGTVHALGDKVGLVASALLDASGASGGTVLVGGDFQGKNPEIQNAARTYVGAGATIKADAAQNGEGGKVVVWSDDLTRFYGNISARGGTNGGDGGFVEVSGKRGLDYNGLADTRAPQGVTGTLLLDPTDITIDNGGVTNGSFDGDPFFTNADPASIDWSVIANQLILSNAIISTSAYGGGVGDITIAANSPDLVSVNTLDLRANNDILINGNITNTGVGNIVMYAGYNDNFSFPGVNIGTGNIALGTNARVQTAGNVDMTAGNSISLGAGATIAGGTNDTLNFVTLRSNLMSLAGAGNSITGANINLFANGFRSVELGGATAGKLLLSQADLDTLNLSTPATGLLQIGDLGPLHLAGPITFNPAKVQNLRLLGAGLTQVVTAPLTVASLHADAAGSNEVLLDTAANNVDLLVGQASFDFKFRNAGSLTVGTIPSTQLPHTGIQVTGGDGPPRANAEITVESGNLTVSGAITASASGGTSTASITLNALAGQVLVNNGAMVVATGGNQFGSGGSPAGAATTSLNGASVTLDGAVRVEAIGGDNLGSGAGGTANTTLIATTGPVQVLNTATVSAVGGNGGGSGSVGGVGIVRLEGSSITVSNADVLATGGGGSFGAFGLVNMIATTGDVNLGSTITATGGGTGATGGFAFVNISSNTGNVTTGADIKADGREGFITILAPNGFIQQSNPLGFLSAISSDPLRFGVVDLTANKGIGTIANPIRIDMASDPDVIAVNNGAGATGDIALSGFNPPVGGVCGAGVTICLEGDLTDYFNANPTGTYYLKAESGDIDLSIPFLPDPNPLGLGLPLLAGQNVTFDAPLGDVVFSPGASIVTSGGGNIAIAGQNVIVGTAAGVLPVLLDSSGSMTIFSFNDLNVFGGSSGSNNSTRLTSAGGQNIAATDIRLTGGLGGVGNFADIRQTGAGSTQNIIVNGAGTLLLSGGFGDNNFARIQSSGTVQNINFASSGQLNVIGGGGTNADFARIQAVTGTQTISGLPSLLLQGGVGGLIDDGNFAQIRADVGLQTIDAGTTFIFASQSGGINNFANITAPLQAITVAGGLTITGGNSTTPTGAVSGGGARIGGRGGDSPSATNLTLDVSGDVLLTGGSIANSGAAIGSNFAGGQTTDITMTVGGDITLTAGSVSGARIGSPYTSIAGGDISVTSGGNIQVNGDTNIETAGMITLAASGLLTLDAAAGNGQARVLSGNGQSITASGISLIGAASGASDFAELRQTGASAVQNITVTGGGTLSLLGGSGGDTNFARIQNEGTAQSINFVSGGMLNLTGGSGTNNNFARVVALTGTQTISGLPTITLQGGSGGLIDDGNFAQIRADVGLQTIDALTTSILAGTGGGINNFANITGPSQAITITGDLIITGGNSTTPTGAVSGGGARIGGKGGATPGPTNLTLDVSGNVLLTGGSVANSGAAIGSNFAGGQTTDITMMVGSNVTLAPGSGAGARIGSPGASVGAGTIVVDAGGNIALNSTGPGLGGFIRTAGNVVLTADGLITQGVDAAILANQLTTTSGLGTSLPGANQFAFFNATNAGGGIAFNAISPFALTGISAIGDFTLTSPVAITLSGPVSATGIVNISSGGAIVDGNTSGFDISGASATLQGVGGVGSVANPLETQVASLTVINSGGEVGILNSGNLTLNGLTFNGTNAAVGTTGSMNFAAPIDASGNLFLAANTGMTVNQQLFASGDIALNSGVGDLSISGSSVLAGNVLQLTGVNVNLNSAGAFGVNGVSVAASGDLNLLNSSELGGFNGNTSVVTGGNVLVDESFLFGEPDVFMTVGGVVNINGDSEFPGVIEAGAPVTINLNFPFLSSGGYFINGIEGVVFDSANNTGFIAGQAPAILGTNLLITYGTGAALVVPTDTLIVAMGDSITPPEPEKDKDIFDDVKDDEEKAPICR